MRPLNQKNDNVAADCRQEKAKNNKDKDSIGQQLENDEDKVYDRLILNEYLRRKAQINQEIEQKREMLWKELGWNVILFFVNIVSEYILVINPFDVLPKVIRKQNNIK